MPPLSGELLERELLSYNEQIKEYTLQFKNGQYSKLKDATYLNTLEELDQTQGKEEIPFFVGKSKCTLSTLSKVIQMQ
jgi:hypothetical protein